MKNNIHELIDKALGKCLVLLEINEDLTPYMVEKTRDHQHGDYASNIALLYGKKLGLKPRDFAKLLQDKMDLPVWLDRIEIAGPGFINFWLNKTAWLEVIRNILDQGSGFGRTNRGIGKRIQLEFVSANPTGPLHVGHGRGAAYGSVVANLFETQGYSVHREYYVNDAGRQMDILATSVWLRYLELCGEELRFPTNGYRGDYVWDIAATLHRIHGDKWRYSSSQVFECIPDDAASFEEQAENNSITSTGNKEAHIDALIGKTKDLLGNDRYRFIFDLGLNVILDDIRDDLHQFGVNYQEWYSERSLAESGAVNRAIECLRKSDFCYEKDGALWFRSSTFGDEKDRVIVRDNGQPTYFASDIAYHLDKLNRDFDRIINIWGADHHGYVPRVKAAIEAAGGDISKLDILLVQFAILYKNGERMQMSTRSGEFITLRQLRNEVGRDATRFFYVMRKCEQHLDFDLDLATSQSNENPVYYIQYAHARICAILRQAKEKGMDIKPSNQDANLKYLVDKCEINLIKKLAEYPELLATAAELAEPHQLTYYLRELAAEFHTYYNAVAILVEDLALRDARLKLILACQVVLNNGLNILGISVPEKM